MKRISSILLLGLLVLAGGCPPPGELVIEPGDCLGKRTIAEALRALALQELNVQAFEAAADCTISWRQADGTEKDENVPGKLIFVPEENIYFGGSKFGEVRFGTNESQFWLMVEPELETYWWGEKGLAGACRESLLLNPADIAEAFGIVDVSTAWQLSHRGGFDILDLYEAERHVKRVYVNACDYRIREIEYFDAEGFKRVSIRLADYTTGESGIVVPGRIWVGYFDRLGLEESAVEIRLKHIRYFPPEKQGPKLFVRPEPRGYKEVLKLSEGCEFELTN